MERNLSNTQPSGKTTLQEIQMPSLPEIAKGFPTELSLEHIQSGSTWLSMRIPGPHCSSLPGLDILCKEPRIVLLQNFVTPEESHHIRELAKPRYERSTLSFDHAVSNSRRSDSAFLRGVEDTVIEAVEDRISLLVRSPVDHLEPLQVVRYRPGQFFRQHFDFFTPAARAPENYINSLRQGGQREYTVILYVNEFPHDDPGGDTVFPRLHISVKPQFRAALAWRNIDFKGIPDENTLHQGNAPEQSTKEIVTCWVREKPFIPLNRL